MNFDRLLKDIDSGKIEKLYMLYGDEYYLVSELVSRIKQKVLSEGAADFNSDTFFGGDCDGVQVRDAIETFPMMAPVRLIIVKNFHRFKEKEMAALAPILEDPIDTSVVVLVADKIDKRKKIYKSIAKNAVMLECKRLFENQVGPWVEYIASKYELKMDSASVSLICQSVGNCLTEIDNEMRKLQQYLGDEKVVSAEIVSKVVSRSRVESVFELANAIGSNDRVQALTRLAHLLDQGENEVGVLSMITRHIRILSQIQDGIKMGLKGGKLGQSVGVHPYFLNQYIDQSRAWTASKIEKTYSALLETDKALKSSPISSHIWLENFILKTCG